MPSISFGRKLFGQNRSQTLYLCTCLSVCFTLCCVFISSVLVFIVICIQIDTNFALQWIFVIFFPFLKNNFTGKWWIISDTPLLPKQFVMIVFLLSLVYCFQPVITMFFIGSYLFGVSTTVTWTFSFRVHLYFSSYCPFIFLLL